MLGAVRENTKPLSRYKRALWCLACDIAFGITQTKTCGCSGNKTSKDVLFDLAVNFNGEPLEKLMVDIHPHLNDVHQRAPK